MGPVRNTRELDAAWLFAVGAGELLHATSASSQTATIADRGFT